MWPVKTIVSGEFSVERQAAQAVDKLLRACLRGEQIRAFFVKQPDRPRRMPARRIEPAGTPIARPGALELDIGPAADADGVEVSACVRNPLPVATLMQQSASASRRHTGILVAVETGDRVSQALAVNVLREHGAQPIERSTAPEELPQAGCQPVALSSLLVHSPQQEEALPSHAVTRH